MKKRKNITIDLEAYERLRNVRRAGESFSQTIKRIFRQPLDVENPARKLRKADDHSE